jgi:hypothetical protein
MFTASFTHRGEHSLLFRRIHRERISPPRDNFTPGDKIHPWGTYSPLGSKFAPRVKLRIGHSSPEFF